MTLCTALINLTYSMMAATTGECSYLHEQEIIAVIEMLYVEQRVELSPRGVRLEQSEIGS